VLAGPACDEAVRRTAWAEDGILALPDAAAHEAMLAELGFRVVDAADWTDLAETCFRRMEEAARLHRAELVAAKGAARYRRWLLNARRYQRWFGERRLVYGRWLARRNRPQDAARGVAPRNARCST
jgi:hypothetical protein